MIDDMTETYVNESADDKNHVPTRDLVHFGSDYTTWIGSRGRGFRALTGGVGPFSQWGSYSPDEKDDDNDPSSG